MDELDTLTALLDMAFHGFGGGSARMSELAELTMFHCISTNHSIYYSSSSLKVFNHASRQFKVIIRKLTTIILRFFSLFWSLIQFCDKLYAETCIGLLLPSRKNRSEYGPKHVIKEIFNFESLPDITQVRQFLAGVSNFVAKGHEQKLFVSTGDIVAVKMGHASLTHTTRYSSEKSESDKHHFNANRFL